MKLNTLGLYNAEKQEWWDRCREMGIGTLYVGKVQMDQQVWTDSVNYKRGDFNCPKVSNLQYSISNKLDQLKSDMYQEEKTVMEHFEKKAYIDGCDMDSMSLDVVIDKLNEWDARIEKLKNVSESKTIKKEIRKLKAAKKDTIKALDKRGC